MIESVKQATSSFREHQQTLRSERSFARADPPQGAVAKELQQWASQVGVLIQPELGLNAWGANVEVLIQPELDLDTWGGKVEILTQPELDLDARGVEECDGEIVTSLATHP